MTTKQDFLFSLRRVASVGKERQTAGKTVSIRASKTIYTLYNPRTTNQYLFCAIFTVNSLHSK